ncbi:DNA repair protein RecN [Fusibacter ferrireducens]|uniref:DNA repair protein RecN n=1 Tax=Fusibacter ferrireducens TaxID=2785058 RepID=A0ABR9ZT87_9FIRM|nr:DNA repair protein RecN [Fusibacter ferrireducens]MBF4693674.1 DNA repair protein RecN [Fusibacter ferrireducens]
MIFELKIKDFILIEDVTVDFLSGLNIITGETGAGKSIILGAIRLILGQTANKDAVRIGADKASIKASFYTNDLVNELLVKYDIPTDDEIVIIAREVQAKGKSISRVNGQVTPLNIIREVTECLIDLHGQNENQKLLMKSNQLNLIDAYGGIPIEEIKRALKSTYREIAALDKAIEALRVDDLEKAKKVDFLTFQLDEISNASLKPDEDTALEKEFEYLSNIEALKMSFEKAVVWMKNDHDEGIVNKLSTLSNEFSKLEAFDDEIVDFSARLKDAFYALEDLSKDVENYKENLEFDPERFLFIERRLDTINALKTKYGQSIAEILAFESAIVEELEYFESIENKVSELKKQRDQSLLIYNEQASVLTDLRQKSAQKLESALQNELIELNMKDTRFKIELEVMTRVHENGLDEVEFLISTNLGQPFKPLKKVVSGGELSRLMLGIKIVLGHLDNIPTLIFDEIDTGISGITANVVGEKLSRLSKMSQVICITHLPQIAVFSDHHLLIEKESTTQNTMTTIKEIDQNSIVDEIGRLVGGMEMTTATKHHAREMIEKAKALKK